MKSGDRITLVYEGKEFDVIVIDPNGLGEGQPSVGFGFRMAERYMGIPRQTLSDWATEIENATLLKLPSGKTLRVSEIIGNDNNDYSVIEASDWFSLAIDLLVNPGKTAKGLRAKLGNFIEWFAVKGFYAEAYVAFKGVYTAKDSRATTQWLEARQLGKYARKQYTDLLQSQGCEGYDYAKWTDYVYEGLFGLTAKEMKDIWDLVEGTRSIARNYIPKAEGLDAVAHCEDMAVRMFVEDLRDSQGALKEAHDDAIKLTLRKFMGGSN
jgi:hypothetical protein